MRRQLSLCFWALSLWEDALRASLKDVCAELTTKVEHATELAAARSAELGELEADQRRDELARIDLAAEIERRELSAASLHKTASDARLANGELLKRLEEERNNVKSLKSEVDRLRKARNDQRVDDDPSLFSLESQLHEALDVQGALRFSLFKSEDEAAKALASRDAGEARVLELQHRLEESRQVYVHAIAALDKRAATLEQEGRDAQSVAQRLERALDRVSFRLRMCNLELQRWKE